MKLLAVVVAVTVAAGCETPTAEAQQPKQATKQDVVGAPTSLHAKVLDVLGGAIDLYCSPNGRVPKHVIEHYAPKGVTRAGGVKLPEGTPFIIETGTVSSLRLFEPFDFVVWWLDPEPDAKIGELVVDLGVSARIVEYGKLVEVRGLGTGRALEQSHPLSDIPHEHVVSCGGQRVRVVVNEIVWQGDFVGKVGRIALSID